MEKHKQQRVVQGLKCCKALNTDCAHCPYMEYVYHCRKYLIKDAHTVIIQIAEERDEAIEQLRNEQEKKEINDTMWSVEDPIRPSLPCGTGRGKDWKENEE